MDLANIYKVRFLSSNIMKIKSFTSNNNNKDQVNCVTNAVSCECACRSLCLALWQNGSTSTTSICTVPSGCWTGCCSRPSGRAWWPSWATGSARRGVCDDPLCINPAFIQHCFEYYQCKMFGSKLPASVQPQKYLVKLSFMIHTHTHPHTHLHKDTHSPVLLPKHSLHLDSVFHSGWTCKHNLLNVKIAELSVKLLSIKYRKLCISSVFMKQYLKIEPKVFKEEYFWLLIIERHDVVFQARLRVRPVECLCLCR